jgi:hypothetical protein
MQPNAFESETRLIANASERVGIEDALKRDYQMQLYASGTFWNAFERVSETDLIRYASVRV